MPSTTPSCGSCWLNHQKCSHRSISLGRCSYCLDHITAGLNNVRTSIKAADPFPETELRQALLPIVTGLVLDTDAADSLTLILDMLVMNDHESRITSTYSGNFDITNQSLVKSFNEAFHRIFAPEIVAKDNACPHVDNACLTGAYLHVFCFAEFDERGGIVPESLNGEESQHSSIEIRLRFLMLCRIGELVETVLRVIRHVDSAESGLAYAAAVLLCYETNFFGTSFKYGTVFNHIPKDIRNILGRWLTSVANELGDYVREGCARHLRWSSAILGSLKKFKKQHHIKTTLKIALSLQDHRGSLPERDEWPKWDAEPALASEGYPLQPDFLILHHEVNSEFQRNALFLQSSIAPSPISLFASSDQATHAASDYPVAPNLSAEITSESPPDSHESMDIDDYINPQPSTFSQSIAGSNQAFTVVDSMHLPFDPEFGMESSLHDNYYHDRDLLNISDGFDLDPFIFHSSDFPDFPSSSTDDALN